MKSILKHFKTKATHFKIFILDDDEVTTTVMEKKLGESLPQLINDMTFEIQSFNNPNGEFVKKMETETPDFLLLDYHLLLENGKEVLGTSVLKKVNKDHPDITVIMLTSESKLDTAVNLMREGAYDFVQKSVSSDVDLAKSIQRRISYTNLLLSSNRNKIMLFILLIVWAISMIVLISMGVLFPA